MIVIPPLEWTAADVVSTNIPTDGETHETWWEDNCYRMFDPDPNQVTLATGFTLDVTLKPTTKFQAIALFNIVGSMVDVYVFDGPVQYPAINSDTAFWDRRNLVWETFQMSDQFPNRPSMLTLLPYPVDPVLYPNARIQIVISKGTGSAVQCGAVLVGPAANVGDTIYSTEVGLIDYSRKERDTFGTMTLIERGYSDTVRYQFALSTNSIVAAKQFLATRRAKATVYATQEWPYDPLIYGYFMDLTLPYENWNISTAQLEVESIVLSVPATPLPDPACYALETAWSAFPVGALTPIAPVFLTDWIVETTTADTYAVMQSVGNWSTDFVPTMITLTLNVTRTTGTPTTNRVYLTLDNGTSYSAVLPVTLGAQTVEFALDETTATTELPPGVAWPEDVAAFLTFWPNCDFQAAVSAIAFTPEPMCDASSESAAQWWNAEASTYNLTDITGSVKTLAETDPIEEYPVGDFVFRAQVKNAGLYTVTWTDAFTGTVPPTLIRLGKSIVVCADLQTDLANPVAVSAGVLTLTASVTNGIEVIQECAPITLTLANTGELPPCGGECVVAVTGTEWIVGGSGATAYGTVAYPE